MTYVQKQKGVSFNYLQFLWGGIAQIRSKQGEGDFGSAMKLAATLIDYLPEEIKKQFQDKADQIVRSMNKIAVGNIKKIKDIPDIFQRTVYKHKLLKTYADEALHDFVTELSNELDAKGYMITRQDIIEGRSTAERRREER